MANIGTGLSTWTLNGSGDPHGDLPSGDTVEHSELAGQLGFQHVDATGDVVRTPSAAELANTNPVKAPPRRSK